MKPVKGGVQCPLKGPGNSRALEALSCYLSLLLKQSDTKVDLKDIVDQNLEGASVAPPLDPPLCSFL